MLSTWQKFSEIFFSPNASYIPFYRESVVIQSEHWINQKNGVNQSCVRNLENR